MTAFIHHLSYDFRSGLRDRSMLLMNYLFPLVFYAMMGVLMTGINPTFVDNMIPGMILVGMMSSALLGLPNPLVSSREQGIYRSFRINGVPASSLVTIPVVSIVLHVLVITVIITATAGPLFGGKLPVQFGWFGLITLVSALALAGLGMLIGVVANNTRTTVLLAQLYFIPSMMLGGLMMPTSMLPAALAKVALLLPTTHAMNAYNQLAMGMTGTLDPYVSLAVLATAALLSFALSAYLFDWDSRNTGQKRSKWLALLALLPYIVAVALSA